MDDRPLRIFVGEDPHHLKHSVAAELELWGNLQVAPTFPNTRPSCEKKKAPR